MTQCSGCGDCCEVVFLSGTLEEMQAHDLRPADAKWVRSGALIPLTQVEAVARRPILGALYPYDWNIDNGGHQVPYRCTNFDDEKRTCKLHGTPDKPEICTGFPWYGAPPDEDGNHIRPFPRCSFWADVGLPFLLGLA